MKITSSGIIRNEDKPRVGVTSNASLDFLDECFTEGIDINYEEVYADVLNEIKAESENDSEMDIENEAAKRMEYYENRGPYLYGDWVKNAEGQYEIDKNGKYGFAVTYSQESGNVSVEWSRTTKRCHHTSPCYVMADGSGPCGDLDTKGDSVIAYCLPDDCIRDDAE